MYVFVCYIMRSDCMIISCLCCVIIARLLDNSLFDPISSEAGSIDTKSHQIPLPTTPDNDNKAFKTRLLLPTLPNPADRFPQQDSLSSSG